MKLHIKIRRQKPNEQMVLCWRQHPLDITISNINFFKYGDWEVYYHNDVRIKLMFVRLVLTVREIYDNIFRLFLCLN